MEKIELLAEVRMGDEKAKDIRKSKKVPAVVYGHSQEPISITIDHSDILKTYRKAGESHIINLKAGKKNLEVLIHDYQKHPVTGDFMHVDFFAITKGEKLHAHIHLHFTGDSNAKKEGAILEEHIKSIEVKCLPSDLIDSFEVDLSQLKVFGDVIRVSDLSIDSKKYEIIGHHADDIIIGAAQPKVVVIEEGAPVSNIGEEDEEEEVKEEAKK